MRDGKIIKIYRGPGRFSGVRRWWSRIWGDPIRATAFVFVMAGVAVFALGVIAAVAQ